MRLKLFLLALIAAWLPALSQKTGLTGLVVDSYTGQPVGDATLMLNSQSVFITAGPDGRFTIDNARPGTDVLVVSAFGYDDLSVPVTLTAGKIEDLGDLKMTPDNLGDDIATQAKFTNSADRASNIIIAPSASETDPAKCIAVTLKSGSAARKALNLMDNSGVYGQTVTLKGTLRPCCGAPGVYQPTEYVLGSEPVTPPTPDQPTTGEGTESNPYTVTSAIAKGETSGKVWVSGYVVVYVEGNTISKAVFSGSADRASNILIADSPDVTDASKCMPVELKSGTAARKALNLMDNTGVYKTKISVEGNVANYMTVPGLRNVTNFKQ